MQNQRKLTLGLALGGAILFSAEVNAAAFMLNEQSPRASGRTYAGEAAIAEDASTIFSNPAGMTELKRAEGQIGTHLIIPRAEISNGGSTASVLGNPPVAFSGESGQGFDPQLSGHMYLAAPVGQGLWAGLAVTVPYALANHYNSDFFGRYDSLRASLRAIDFAPSVAYSVAPWISIGGGIDIQYMDAKLVNALPNPFDPSGSPTPATDGRFTAEGDDWSVGYNLGVLLKPTNDLRVGLTYRSAITHDIKGDATTEFAGTTTVQDVSTELNLPYTVALGAAYDVSPTVTLLGQVGYYGWSRLNELRLKLANGSEQATTEDFRDSWSVSVGAQWAVARGWVLRGGMMYDMTPTRDQHRSTIIPDVDRVWAAIGATYELSDTVALDVSYQHMFAKEGPINRVNDFSSTLGTVVRTTGTTETSADIIGLSLRMQF